MELVKAEGNLCSTTIRSLFTPALTPSTCRRTQFMATMITNGGINCGACEPECPNNAISQGETIFVIDPQLCTDSVGFHDYEACAAVCPVDCCVTDPNNIETEEVLDARVQSILRRRSATISNRASARDNQAARPDKTRLRLKRHPRRTQARRQHRCCGNLDSQARAISNPPLISFRCPRLTHGSSDSLFQVPTNACGAGAQFYDRQCHLLPSLPQVHGRAGQPQLSHPNSVKGFARNGKKNRPPSPAVDAELAEFVENGPGRRKLRVTSATIAEHIRGS